MNLDIQKNELHYYLELQRSSDITNAKNTESSERVLSNIIRTMKLSRNNNICGEDFSGFDLGNIPLNGIHWSIDGNNSTSFYGCTIKDSNLQSGHYHHITAAVWSRDGHNILTGGTDEHIFLWNTNNGLIIRHYAAHTENVETICYSLDETMFAIGDCNGYIEIYNLIQDKSIFFVKGHRSPVDHITFSPDRKYVLSGSNDRTIKLWNISEKRCIHAFEQEGNVGCVAFSPNGEYYITTVAETPCLFDEEVEHYYTRIWELKTNKCICTFEDHQAGVEYACFSLDSKKCLTGSRDGTIRLWDILTSSCIRVIEGDNDQFLYVSFCPDENYCISISLGNTIGLIIKKWDLNTSCCLYSKELPRHIIISTLRNDLVLSHFGEIKRIDTGTIIRKLENHNSTISSVTISSDGIRCLFGADDGTVKEFNLSDNRIINEYIIDSSDNSFKEYSNIKFVSLDIEGYCVAVFENVVRLLDQKSNQYFDISTSHDLITAFAVSNDDTYFLTGDSSGEIEIRSLNNFQIVMSCSHTNSSFPLMSPTPSIKASSFSYDSQLFVTGANDNTAKIWSIKENKCLCTLNGHSYHVIAVDLSIDNQYCITGSMDRSVKIWGIETAECLHTIKFEMEEFITSVSFIHDTDYCFIGFKDRFAKIFNYKNGQFVRKITIQRLKNGESIWRFPYCFLLDSESTCMIYKINKSCTRIKQIGRFRNIEALHIKNCNFEDIIATDTVKQTLAQYGAVAN